MLPTWAWGQHRCMEQPLSQRAALSPSFGVCREWAPTSNLLGMNNTCQWNLLSQTGTVTRQRQECNQRGWCKKNLISSPRTLCCPIFHIPGNSSAGPSLPHLRFNSWLDSTSLLCCQLLLLSWCLQYTKFFFFSYCFSFSSQILLVRWWRWRVLTYTDLRAQFWEVGL